MENIKAKDAVKNADKEKFIQIIQHYSCLWNTSLDESKDKNVRENAWKEVVQLLLEKTLDSNSNELSQAVDAAKSLFKTLRDRYMKLKRLYKPSGSAGGHSLEPKWPYFNLLQFLDPFVKHRKTMSNFEVQNDQCGNADQVIDQVNYSSESLSNQPLGDLNLMSLFTIENNNQPGFSGSASNSYLVDLNTSASSLSTTSTNENMQTFIDTVIECDDENTTSKKFHEHDVTPPYKKVKKSSKAKLEPNSYELLLKSVIETNEFIMKSHSKSELSGEDLFGQTVALELTKMSEYQRDEAKFQIMNVIRKVKWSLPEVPGSDV
jgi:hypothetical protein